MTNPFINDVAESEEERSKLETLGVSTPLGLVSLYQAAGEAVEDFLGRDRVQTIVQKATGMLSDEDRAVLAQGTPKPRKLGAWLTPRPK